MIPNREHLRNFHTASKQLQGTTISTHFCNPYDAQ